MCPIFVFSKEMEFFRTATLCLVHFYPDKKKKKKKKKEEKKRKKKEEEEN